MSTYKDSGVNIDAGDQASAMAYQAAKSTFPARAGMIGEPVRLDGGFAGLLDFGDYYLVKNDDGVGTKIAIAEAINDFSTLGYDLLAMVVDDAICLGAEVVSVTNTIDCNKVKPEVVEPMMNGLAAACREQKIVIPGGEIAEMNTMVNGYIWNASALGIVAKDKVITGKDVQFGDQIIGLPDPGFRSNGFSLVRYVLKNTFGENWFNQIYEDGVSWGKTVLTPSRIYHNDLLQILGRHGEARKLNIRGIAHITGGGLAGNFERILKHDETLGAKFTDLLEPPAFMQKIVELGGIAREEAYRTFNMGIAMTLVVDPATVEPLLAELTKLGINAKLMGEITATGKIEF